MNENVESLNMETNENPIVNDFEASEFSDDFFETKEMDELPLEQWHTDDNIVLNLAPEAEEVNNSDNEEKQDEINKYGDDWSIISENISDKFDWFELDIDTDDDYLEF